MSITPHSDAVAQALVQMRAHVEGLGPAKNDFDAAYRLMQIDVTSAILTFYGEMADRQQDAAKTFDAVAQSVGAAVASMLMTYHNGDRGLSLSTIEPMAVSIKDAAMNRVTGKGRHGLLRAEIAETSVHGRA